MIGGKEAETRREDEKAALPVRNAWLEDKLNAAHYTHTQHATQHAHTASTHSKPHSTLYTPNAPP